MQKGFYEDLSRLPTVNEETIENDLGRLDVHLKLRDKAVGVPFVDSLAIFNARGKLINFSRHWPSPDLNVADQDFFKALKNGYKADVLSRRDRCRRHVQADGSRHLARRIAGPNGEFLGVISASLISLICKIISARSALDPDSSLALFRNDGSLLARYPENQSDIGRKFANAIAIAAGGQRRPWGRREEGVIDGSYRMVAAYRVTGYPLVASATKTTTAILAHWQQDRRLRCRRRRFVIAVIAAFAFLFTCACSETTRRWRRPAASASGPNNSASKACVSTWP